ncbi:MAG: ABC transporter permease [Acidimicrobiales bacterium]
MVGIGLGLLLGRYRVLNEMFDPLVNLFNATPMVAILPLVIIWLGLGFNARILYIVLLSIWTVLINTSEGMANMPKAFGDLGRAFGLPERQIVWKIGVPSAMPYLVTGLRVAIGRAVIGMVIAEMQVNEVGTGGLVQSYGGAFEPARLLAVVLVLAIVGWALVSGLRVFTRWRYPWMAEIASSRR